MSLVDDLVPLTTGGYEITPRATHRIAKSGKTYLYAEIYEPAMAAPGAVAKDMPAVGVQMEILDPATGKVKKDFGGDAAAAA